MICILTDGQWSTYLIICICHKGNHQRKFVGKSKILKKSNIIKTRYISYKAIAGTLAIFNTVVALDFVFIFTDFS